MARRRSTNAAQRAHAAQAVAHTIAAPRWLAPGKRIGLYASMPQELGTAPLIELALQRGCRVYLPRITSMRARRMQFVAASRESRQHSFVMHEPEGDES